jgi:predicted SnoaL-like aldol condensation-catalyzing enzyme
MSNLERLRAGAKAAFVDRDIDAVDDYWAEDYIQHSLYASGGREGFKEALRTLPADFAYTPARAFEDGDYAVLHGTYAGFGPAPLVAFDLMRMEDGKNAEHWDILVPIVEPTVSGRSQTDGPADVEDLDRTDANKALVAEFAEKVLIGRDYSALADYISSEEYHQHNPEAADGLDGFGAAVAQWASEGKELLYRTVHQLVGQGNFVLTVCEGEFGVPVAYWDLWRLKDGKIVEHWDAIQPIPEATPHGNGVF